MKAFLQTIFKLNNNIIKRPNLTDNNYLTFSNVLSNVYATLKNITMSAIGINTMTFDTTIARTTLAEGNIAWDSTKKCLLIGMPNGSILEVGKENYIEFQNNTGSTITNGTPLVYGSAIGNSGKIRALPAIADGTYKPCLFIGIATNDVADGGIGYATWFGDVNGVQSDGANFGETWVDGETVYVSATTAGYLTKTRPEAPNYMMQVGFIINAHASNGSIKLQPKTNMKLMDLADVDGTPLDTTGQILVWDNDRQVWDPTDNINNYALSEDVAEALSAKLSATITDPVTGQVIGFDGTNWVNTNQKYSVWGKILTQADDYNFCQLDSNFTIQNWTIYSRDDQDQSAEFDILVGDTASIASASSIVASGPPTMTTAKSATTSTLTGWITSVSAGKFVFVKLVSITGDGVDIQVGGIV